MGGSSPWPIEARLEVDSQTWCSVVVGQKVSVKASRSHTWCSVRHSSEENAVIPKAPDVKNPVTANTMINIAGTRIGLKMKKSGVAIVSPIIVPVRMRPKRRKQRPPMGKKVRTARTFHVECSFCC
ncbi:hypothetical protein L1987_64895 [Smallanthus sonchifolius]|uniref:Uncharacterized protein n=1 Tax=Smallanthus sonchifolius TaxID=185202 RepID=A0ACB9BSV4_9ASTR|nr:hypothetical protein L1987_64895 [Smallanthus sonchifolius]